MDGFGQYLSDTIPIIRHNIHYTILKVKKNKAIPVTGHGGL
jgi:hypothetical protein